MPIMPRPSFRAVRPVTPVMASRPTKVLVAVVVALGIAQIFFEDAVVFLGATGRGGQVPPVVYIAVPAAISLLLVLVLIGGALWYADRLH